MVLSSKQSPEPRLPADPAQVRRVQKILSLPVTGRLCRATITAAAVYAKSWHRGPSLIPLVLQAARTTSSLPPAATAGDTSSG